LIGIRCDLDPVEEAKAYDVLMKEYHMTQEELSEKLGKSRSQIANYIRLLQLDPFSLDMLEKGKITVGHGKVLAGINDPQQQMLFARMTAEQQLSVRELEALLEPGGAKKPRKKLVEKTESKYSELEDALKIRTGSMVKLLYNDGKGRIEIPFTNDEELMRLTELLLGDEENLESKQMSTKKPFTV